MPTLSLPHPLPVVEYNWDSRYWQQDLGFASERFFSPHDPVEKEFSAWEQKTLV